MDAGDEAARRTRRVLRVPPHIMIVSAQIANSTGFPSRHKVEQLMQASEGDSVVHGRA
jgi:hypothetical protein